MLELTSISSTGVASGQLVNLQGNSLLYVTDVWLDAEGDLFISDLGFDFNTDTTYIPKHPQVLEVHANGSVSIVANATTPSGCGVKGPDSAEGDAAGNLFIGDDIPDSNGDGYFSGRIVEYPAGGGTCIVTGTALGETLGGPGGGNGIGEVNLSPSGDIYVGVRATTACSRCSAP